MADWIRNPPRPQGRPIENESFEAFCNRQRARVARSLTMRERQRKLDPGGGYQLTIKGSKPAQIALTETPEELLKMSGEVGYRAASLTYLSGN